MRIPLKPTELYLPNNIFGCTRQFAFVHFLFLPFVYLYLYTLRSNIYISDNTKYSEAAIDVQSDVNTAVHTIYIFQNNTFPSGKIEVLPVLQAE